ncbi:protein FAM111A-like isoform X2 [Colossoma macropomum]|nr:protein FAM111A-like isoform X2 [Colossoma macropomum]
MTVLEALKRSKRFRGIQLKNRDKEIVIQREKFPKAVVNTGFPCSLIDEQETLDVSFIKGEAPSQVGETALDHPHTLRAEDLVSFNIRTKGGKNIRQIMKNQELKLELDFVCVHAKRGENLRKALKRDGRFTDVIFRKRCALIELESEVITEMSNGVDHLDGKHLQVIRFDDSALLVSFKATGSRKVLRTMSDVSDTAPRGSQTENPRKLVRTKPRELAKTSLKSMDVTAVLQACKMIPNSEELFKTLSAQCRCLLSEMKKHSRLKSYKDLLRVEYDKGKRGFSKISDVKRLMQLSDSVCKIIIDGEPNGTGFLLFDKFILTCAHVIDCEPRSKPRKLKDPVTAEFDYEDNKTKQVFQVKEDIVSCSHEVEGEGPFLDFALLELGELIPQAGGSVKSAETAESTPPALLKGSTSSAKTKVTKSICIIGHPDCLSKKYDVCSVIRDDKWKSTTNDRLSQMTDKVLHILSELSLEDDWNYNSSQITYDTCFFDGSSGSPVFNKRCELIGIHTGGYAYEDSKNKFRSLMEYGFPIGPVLKRIMIQSRERGRNDVLTILESLVIQQDTLDSPTDKDFHTTPLNPVIKSAQDKRDNITDKTPKLNLS